MNIRFMIALLLIVCSVKLAYAQAPDAVVEKASGNALVKDQQGKKTRPLRKGDKLLAGEWVSCANGCKELIISYCNLNIPVLSKPEWKRIISINCEASDGERGGGSKGEGVRIISPKESQLVEPDNFLVRWNPYKSPVKLTLTLKIHHGEEIWGPQQADGSKNSFTSDSLKTALKKAQADGDLHLVLMIDDGNQPIQRIKFDLIPVSDQKDMKRKLESLAGEDNQVLKAFGRGMVFSEYELYGEAVGEIEKALAISQAIKTDESNLVELINLAIKVNYKAYNDDRVKQLCASVKSFGSTLPDPCSWISH